MILFIFLGLRPKLDKNSLTSFKFLFSFHASFKDLAIASPTPSISTRRSGVFSIISSKSSPGKYLTILLALSGPIHLAIDYIYRYNPLVVLS